MKRGDWIGQLLCWLGFHDWTKWSQGHGVAFLLAGLEPTLACNWRRCQREDCEMEDFD